MEGTSAVELARAQQQARLERLAPPPVVAAVESEDEQAAEEDQHVERDEQLHRAREDAAERAEVRLPGAGDYDEAVELDDNESPAGGIVCPWSVVVPPAVATFAELEEEAEQQHDDADSDSVEAEDDPAALPRWSGEGALPVPQSPSGGGSSGGGSKQEQLDAALAGSLQRQLNLTHDEDLRLKDLSANKHQAGFNPYRQQLTVAASPDVRTYRAFDYDEAFDVESDDDDVYDATYDDRVCGAFSNSMGKAY